MNQFTKAVVSVLCACMMTTTVIAADIGTVNVDVLNVRSAASTEAPVVGQLTNKTPVSVQAGADGWYKISYAGGEAYVMSQYVSLQFLEDGTTFLYDAPLYGIVNVDSLRVRASASYEGEIARMLYMGSGVELIGESGDFYCIQDKNGVIQFIAKAYVNVISYEEYQQSAGAYSVIEKAMEYIGTPYRYGGSSPSGFDCSGFTSYVYAQMGISLNRTAAGQLSNGYYVTLEEMQPGDLVFFASGGYVNHVGIYIGDGNMIHSPYSGKTVCVESIYNGYFAPRLYGARRIF